VEDQSKIQELIDGCSRNDPRSQRQLYNTYAARMFGVCVAYSQERADAEDTLHDGFMKIFNNIKQYKGDGAFEGWMRRIMVNTALEKYRRHHKLMTITDELRSSSEISIEHVLEEIAAGEIMEAVQALSPQYRMVFLLYAVEGYNHKEISTMLNISEGTSKSNLSRARGILQERLKSSYDQPTREASIIPFSQ
jgi:RNA polymerase sigma factor (sigma-70 family)